MTQMKGKQSQDEVIPASMNDRSKLTIQQLLTDYKPQLDALVEKLGYTCYRLTEKHGNIVLRQYDEIYDDDSDTDLDTSSSSEDDESE